MDVVAVIQARMGSTRLPGKVMLPLACEHVLVHVVRRVRAAETVDEVVVATSTESADDVVATYAERAGATAFRGSETDVLGRVHGAAAAAGADVVVRITADCPLVSPDAIDAVVRRLAEAGADYASNVRERTFPRGLDVEAFTVESLETVQGRADAAPEREHVTLYYREHPEEFDLVDVTAAAVFDDERLHDRTDLRLTLDEADDYELLREVYENASYEDLLDVRAAVRYVDEHGLGSVNEDVAQKPT